MKKLSNVRYSKSRVDPSIQFMGRPGVNGSVILHSLGVKFGRRKRRDLARQIVSEMSDSLPAYGTGPRLLYHMLRTLKRSLAHNSYMAETVYSLMLTH